ncbi:3343_t:CDS:2 [Funneliformis geosporum]|nr:3343_t:CDS:2 [Funneliformis geosporum]
MDFEEYNTSTSEERNENDINQIALASTRTLLNSDENDNVDWSETSVQSLTLTPCLVMNAIQGEIKCYNGITNLRRLEQMIGTWEIDIDVVENIKSDLYQLEVLLSSETDHLRKIRHITTNAEKAILIKLFEFEKELPEIANSKVLSKIQTVSSNWTAERVK